MDENKLTEELTEEEKADTPENEQSEQEAVTEEAQPDSDTGAEDSTAKPDKKAEKAAKKAQKAEKKQAEKLAKAQKKAEKAKKEPIAESSESEESVAEETVVEETVSEEASTKDTAIGHEVDKKAQQGAEKQQLAAEKKALREKKKAYNKSIHKTKKTVLAVLKGAAITLLLLLISIMLLVVLLVPAVAVGEKIVFAGFYANSKRFEKIPAHNEKFVPQGYIFLNEPDIRLACGYMSDGTASRIYVLEDEKSPVCISMKNVDGSDYTGHTGGIDVLGDFVYVTGDTGCDIFSLADILDGDGIATVRNVLPTINNPAYCVIRNGVLYVGAFYRAGNYETPASHHFTTPAGDQNTALLAVYTLDSETGLAKKDVPDYVISTQGLVQGMTFIDDNTAVLATSYGLSKSRLYVYDLEKMTESETGFAVSEEATVPLKFLDSACLKETITAPPMAEQIVYDGNRIYVMHEAASMKYIFGKFTCGPYVYGYKY